MSQKRWGNLPLFVWGNERGGTGREDIDNTLMRSAGALSSTKIDKKAHERIDFRRPRFYEFDKTVTVEKRGQSWKTVDNSVDKVDN